MNAGSDGPAGGPAKKEPGPGEEPWYSEGLRFQCQRCGKCCRGDPGYVWVEKDEARAAAEFLGISPKEFLSRHCRRVFTRISLIEHPNGDCVFYGPEGCRIYPVRPRQCRTFPFWTHLLRNRRTWDRLQERCPGAGRGRLWSREEIEAVLGGLRSVERSEGEA